MEVWIRFRWPVFNFESRFNSFLNPRFTRWMVDGFHDIVTLGVMQKHELCKHNMELSAFSKSDQHIAWQHNLTILLNCSTIFYKVCRNARSTMIKALHTPTKTSFPQKLAWLVALTKIKTSKELRPQPRIKNECLLPPTQNSPFNSKVLGPQIRATKDLQSLGLSLKKTPPQGELHPAQEMGFYGAATAFLSLKDIFWIYDLISTENVNHNIHFCTLTVKLFK